jgi:hypothetical protein
MKLIFWKSAAAAAAMLLQISHFCAYFGNFNSTRQTWVKKISIFEDEERINEIVATDMFNSE